MAKIIEYTLVEAELPGKLITWVNEKIAEGYQPFGSVAVSKRRYTQAMVKYQP